MSDLDDTIRQAVTNNLQVVVNCTVDSDGDHRVQVRLFWDGDEFHTAEDYHDRTGAKLFERGDDKPDEASQ